MAPNSTRLLVLFRLYLDNSINPVEYRELMQLLDEERLEDNLSPELQDLWHQAAEAEHTVPATVWDDKMQFLIKQLSPELTPRTPVKKLSSWYRRAWTAAAIFLVLIPGLYLFLKTTPASTTPTVAIKPMVTNPGIQPGSNKAVLILADGSSISLDSASGGKIASQGNTSVIKLNTGQLQYSSSAKTPSEILFNTLVTPRGGQYQVTLADGTIVWLNSESSLRYPAEFRGASREVSISGEAYFEVAKHAGLPFLVNIEPANAAKETVEVLGTHFNINAYHDEPMVSTTLFEGSIQLHHPSGVTRIKPGQQFRSEGSNISVVNDADLEAAIAWKQGLFQFEDADIRFVMRQISRWYDIEVVFKGAVSRHFDGTISKNVNILKVLNMLELTGEVKFTVEGKKVVVLPS